MNKKYSIAEARHDLARVVRKVEAGQCIRLTRYGRPVAVIVSEHAFEQLQTRSVGYWETFQIFNTAFSKISLKRNDFLPSRAMDKGRPFPWKN